jgi:hypothetical protein
LWTGTRRSKVSCEVNSVPSEDDFDNALQAKRVAIHADISRLAAERVFNKTGSNPFCFGGTTSGHLVSPNAIILKVFNIGQ